MSVLTKGFRKYTMNPALGFLPIALLPMGSLLDVDSQWLFIAAIASSIGIDVYCRKVLQTQIFSIITVASVISLLLAMAFYLSLGHRFEQAWAYVVFCEVSLVLLLFAVRQSKKYIGTHYFSRSDMREKSLLRDIFTTVSLGECLFTFHLFGVLLYVLNDERFRSVWLDKVVFYGLPVAIVVALGVYGSNILRLASVRLFREEWLPIVNEQGNVIGKVAKSVSMSMKNRFLHPVVRIALVNDGAIYLQKRCECSTFQPDLLDVPFEKYILFKHDLNLAARNSIAQQLGDVSLPLKFQLKYTYEDSHTKRLVLFYVARLSSPTELACTQRLKGKFWTQKQIEDELHSGIFGECFLREYEFMKQTLLNPICQEAGKAL